MNTSHDKQIYDVIVIGAGIQGAGVAQAAALQGWKVKVLEQFDQCAKGTSSKSSKLIHGGLRYLEGMQLKLVYECLREKKLLLKNAPDLVKPTKFLIPVYLTSQRSPIWIWAGLMLYSLLSGQGIKGFRKHNLKLEAAGLKKDGILRLFEYQDAQTNDAELTRAVLKSAESLGAEIGFNSPVKTIDYDSGVFDLTTAEGEVLKAKSVVNAGGPWVNKIQEAFIEKDEKPHVDLVQGAHIVVDKEAPEQCFYLESPIDRRAFFVLPWQGKTMIGTTETQFCGAPENCQPLQSEIEYLLESYNHFFPREAMMEKDIIDKFVGLRVLPSGQGKNYSGRSRETILWSPSATNAYLAIYGGKLTSYRAVAEKVVKNINKQVIKSSTLKSTIELKLS